MDDKGMDAFFDMMDMEFDGKSWNGPSFMATLDRLDAAEAARTDTWEGYSAWGVAMHVAKCKRIIAADLWSAGLGGDVPDWPYPDEAYFPSPELGGEEAWARDKALLRACHEACMKAVRAMPALALGDVMPTWKAPWRDILAWLMTHDAFHGAQLRSMGLPSLKAERIR